jgi:uncharacterized membrane protein HdeD (DUF308 family)
VQLNASSHDPLAHIWGVLLLQGIMAVVVGLMLVTWPAATTIALVQVLGIYWLVTGILALVSMFMDHSLWGWKLCAGILGILASIVILRNPLWSAFVIPFFIVLFLGIQGIIQGAINFIHAFRGYGWGAALLGIINLLFGILILSSPLIATLVLPIVLGSFALVAGIVAIIGAFRIHGFQKKAMMDAQPV